MTLERRPKPESLLPLSYVEYHVLLSLRGQELHGYGVIKDVEARTDGRTVLEAGTLYGAIKRLVDGDLLEELDPSPDEEAHPGRPRRRYRLTGFGEEVLAAEARRLAELVELAKAKDVLPAGPRPLPEPNR